MVALVGMPNTGKSTLFNALTGGQARIGNWPGLTVELLRGRIPAEGAASSLNLVDLPGIHDLSGRSEDEAVVQRFLRETPPDLVLVVLNAGQVSHQLRLLLQIQALGLPLVAALNMSDEAERLGLLIDAEGLTTALGSAVLMVSARNRRGLVPLVQQLRHVAMSGSGVPSLGGPRANDQPLEVFQQTLLNRFVQVPEPLVHRRTRALDRVLLHPIGGLGVFLLLVLAVFQLLYAFTTLLQDLLGTGLDGVQAALLQPGLEALRCPAWLQGFLLEGLWLGVGTVVTFMPLIFLFYVLIGLIEDSGYLPRAAFLMDGLMRVLGLDGRAFVLQVLGFGCNVPSIVGTRVIRDRGMRLLAMLTIPFSLCQARLVVFVFMAGVFFPRPWWAPGLVLFGFYMLSFVAAIITGLVFKRVYPSREGLVLELPPYRAPSPTTILRRGGSAMLNFLFTTRSFIILGAAGIWLLTHLPPSATPASGQSWAAGIGHLFQPLLGPIGMNPELTVSLFFGFIAKEILLGAMAVIYATSEGQLGGVLQQAITPVQALSFMTFVLLYTPCLGTIAAQIKESGQRRFAAVSLAWSLTLAWLMAFVVFRVGQGWMASD